VGGERETANPAHTCTNVCSSHSVSVHVCVCVHVCMCMQGRERYMMML